MWEKYLDGLLLSIEWFNFFKKHSISESMNQWQGSQCNLAGSLNEALTSIVILNQHLSMITKNIDYMNICFMNW